MRSVAKRDDARLRAFLPLLLGGRLFAIERTRGTCDYHSNRGLERFKQHATRDSKRGMRGIRGILSPRRHHVAASRMARMARRIGSDSIGHAATIFSSSGGRLGGRFATGTSQVVPGKGITEIVLESTKPKVTGSTPVGCNRI